MCMSTHPWSYNYIITIIYTIYTIIIHLIYTELCRQSVLELTYTLIFMTSVRAETRTNTMLAYPNNNGELHEQAKLFNTVFFTVYKLLHFVCLHRVNQHMSVWMWRPAIQDTNAVVEVSVSVTLTTLTSWGVTPMADTCLWGWVHHVHGICMLMMAREALRIIMYCHMECWQYCQYV